MAQHPSGHRAGLVSVSPKMNWCCIGWIDAAIGGRISWSTWRLRVFSSTCFRCSLNMNGVNVIKHAYEQIILVYTCCYWLLLTQYKPLHRKSESSTGSCVRNKTHRPPRRFNRLPAFVPGSLELMGSFTLNLTIYKMTLTLEFYVIVPTKVYNC